MPKDQSFHLQLPHFHFDGSKNVRTLYAVRFLRDLVYRLAFFFLPIYLYQNGSSDPFWQFLPGGELQKGVLLLVAFYLVHRVTILFTAIPIGKIITKIGYRKSMIIGFVLYGIMLSLLYATEQPGWLLLLAAAINGLETSFFWNSFYTLISKLTLRRHMGQGLGVVQFLIQLAQALAPAIGGVIVVAYGFSSLFMVGLIGILLAIIFTFGLRVGREPDRVSWREMRRWLQEKSFIRLASSFAGRYINDAGIVLWPLYVFILLGSIDRVGFLYTLSLFLAMILSFVVGIYIDHSKSKKPFFASGGFLSFLWLLRAQVVSFWQIALIDTVDRLTGNFHWLFFDSISMKRGKGSQALSFFVYREMIMSIAAIAFWIIVGSAFLLIANAWQALFVVAAVGVMMSLLVKEHQE